MNNAKISVIVPIYNSAEYLEDTLESIINQTYKNLEIILVNDGSRDNSPDIMQEYAKRDKRIRLINKKNGGVSSARNAGIGSATGDYIGYVDADDIIEPDMYEYLLGKALEHDADIVGCGIIQDGKRVCTPKKDIVVSARCALSYGKVRKVFSGACWCRLYKRYTVEAVRFSEDYPIGEDLLYNLHALEGALCVAFCSEPKYHYITRQSSALHIARSREKLTSYRRMLAEALSLFGARGAVRKYLIEENLINNADITSKIVLSDTDEFDDIYSEVRGETKKSTARILFASGIGLKMKLKLLLMAYFDGAYRRAVKKVHADT